MTSSSHIDCHFSTFLMTAMTIDKLQKVATTHVNASFKARWWWNSSTHVKPQNMFPYTFLLCKKVLGDWLYKASFWAEILQAIIISFGFFIPFIICLS